MSFISDLEKAMKKEDSLRLKENRKAKNGGYQNAWYRKMKQDPKKWKEFKESKRIYNAEYFRNLDPERIKAYDKKRKIQKNKRQKKQTSQMVLNLP